MKPGTPVHIGSTSRLRVQLHSGRTLDFGACAPLTGPAPACGAPLCPRCGKLTQLISSLDPWHKTRGPPAGRTVKPSTPMAA
jgi:hypothetical protein